jgi:hypothetical protein
MSRLPALALALALASACQGDPAAVIDVGAGTLRLPLTDPALLERVPSLITLMYLNLEGINPCAELVDASVAELVARSPSARQVIDLGATSRHAFGNIGAGGAYSFVLLGSTKPPEALVNQTDVLAAASGSVVAVGCEEVFVRQHHRFDVPITLFPAGLR